jgi:hypothetical protein
MGLRPIRSEVHATASHGTPVSDEFAVPLCRTHHRAVHRHGDEVAWWKSAGIDPVAIAQRLWQHSRLDTVQAAKDGAPEPSAGPADQ